MRRFWLVWVLLPALVLPVQARADHSYAAFVVDSGPNGEFTGQLLEGLYDRGIRATFLLQGEKMALYPDILQHILRDRHEAACRGFTGDSMNGMSRRTIAAEIMEFQTLLPEGYPLRLFCPPGGCNDAVRQVAKARRLAILSWCRGADTPAGEVRDGDLILLRDSSSQSVQTALALADQLLDRGFRLVTVSQLARRRGITVRPGQVYTCFPPEGQDEAR